MQQSAVEQGTDLILYLVSFQLRVPIYFVPLRDPKLIFGMINRHQGSALKYHGCTDSQIGIRHQPIIGQARDRQIRAAPAPDVELTFTHVEKTVVHMT